MAGALRRFPADDFEPPLAPAAVEPPESASGAGAQPNASQDQQEQ